MCARSRNPSFAQNLGIRAAPLLVAALTLSAPAAAADPKPDAATLDAARALGRAGLDLADKGDCQGALEKIRPAYSLYKAPTLGLAAARCEEKLGKIAAAEVFYREVMEADLGPSPVPIFVDAKRAAAAEHERILPRVPRLIINVEPSDGSGDGIRRAIVRLDGAAIEAQAIGAPMLVEIGAHDIVGTRGEVEDLQNVELHEGEQKTVTLKLEPSALNASPRTIGDPGRNDGKTQRAIGWAVLGLGVAGLAAGAITGGLMLSKKSDLDAKGCEDARCPDTIQDKVDAYNALRPITGVALIAGGAIAASGVVVLLTAPSSRAKSASGSRGPQISARLGFLSMGISGTF